MTALPDDAPGSNDTRVTYQDGQRYEIRHTVTIPWKERDGRQQQNEEVVQPGAKTIKAARARAIKRGYPVTAAAAGTGSSTMHIGSWWVNASARLVTAIYTGPAYTHETITLRGV